VAGGVRTVIHVAALIETNVFSSWLEPLSQASLPGHTREGQNQISTQPICQDLPCGFPLSRE